MKDSIDIKSKFDASAWLIRVFYNNLLLEKERADKITSVKQKDFEEAANCRAREKQILEIMPPKEEIERIMEIALA